MSRKLKTRLLETVGFLFVNRQETNHLGHAGMEALAGGFGVEALAGGFGVEALAGGYRVKLRGKATGYKASTPKPLLQKNLYSKKASTPKKKT